jgi:hypothetical protein
MSKRRFARHSSEHGVDGRMLPLTSGRAPDRSESFCATRGTNTGDGLEEGILRDGDLSTRGPIPKPTAPADRIRTQTECCKRLF